MSKGEAGVMVRVVEEPPLPPLPPLPATLVVPASSPALASPPALTTGAAADALNGLAAGAPNAPTTNPPVSRKIIARIADMPLTPTFASRSPTHTYADQVRAPRRRLLLRRHHLLPTTPPPPTPPPPTMTPIARTTMEAQAARIRGATPTRRSRTSSRWSPARSRTRRQLGPPPWYYARRRLAAGGGGGAM